MRTAEPRLRRSVGPSGSRAVGRAPSTPGSNRSPGRIGVLPAELGSGAGARSWPKPAHGSGRRETLLALRLPHAGFRRSASLDARPSSWAPAEPNLPTRLERCARRGLVTPLEKTLVVTGRLGGSFMESARRRRGLPVLRHGRGVDGPFHTKSAWAATTSALVRAFSYSRKGSRFSVSDWPPHPNFPTIIFACSSCPRMTSAAANASTLDRTNGFP